MLSQTAYLYIGVACGVSIVTAITICGLWCCCCRKKKQMHNVQNKNPFGRQRHSNTFEKNVMNSYEHHLRLNSTVSSYENKGFNKSPILAENKDKSMGGVGVTNQYGDLGKVAASPFLVSAHNYRIHSITSLHSDGSISNDTIPIVNKEEDPMDSRRNGALEDNLFCYQPVNKIKDRHYLNLNPEETSDEKSHGSDDNDYELPIEAKMEMKNCECENGYADLIVYENKITMDNKDTYTDIVKNCENEDEKYSEAYQYGLRKHSPSHYEIASEDVDSIQLKSEYSNLNVKQEKLYTNLDYEVPCLNPTQTDCEDVYIELEPDH